MADFGIGSVMGGGFSGLGGFGAGFMEHKSPTTVLPKLVEPAQIGDYLECDVILSRTATERSPLAPARCGLYSAVAGG